MVRIGIHFVGKAVGFIDGLDVKCEEMRATEIDS